MIYCMWLGIDGTEVRVNVHFNTVKAVRGSTDGRCGPKLEPDEPAYIDIGLVERQDGRVVELSDEQLTEIREEIADWLQGRYDQDPHEGEEV